MNPTKEYNLRIWKRFNEIIAKEGLQGFNLYSIQNEAH